MCDYILKLVVMAKQIKQLHRRSNKCLSIVASINSNLRITVTTSDNLCSIVYTFLTKIRRYNLITYI